MRELIGDLIEWHWKSRHFKNQKCWIRFHSKKKNIEIDFLYDPSFGDDVQKTFTNFRRSFNSWSNGMISSTLISSCKISIRSFSENQISEIYHWPWYRQLIDESSILKFLKFKMTHISMHLWQECRRFLKNDIGFKNINHQLYSNYIHECNWKYLSNPDESYLWFLLVSYRI